jgi:hypothetical protein
MQAPQVEEQAMSSDNLPHSDYDKAGDFYYNFITGSLRQPDSFFHENVAIMLDMLGDVEGRRVCDLACAEANTFDRQLRRIAPRVLIVKAVKSQRELG